MSDNLALARDTVRDLPTWKRLRFHVGSESLDSTNKESVIFQNA